MTGTSTVVLISAAAALIAFHPERVSAQAAPPPPRVTSSAAATAPAAPAPLLTSAAVAPPPPPKIVVPASALPPKDSAVALCNNGTFVMEPGTPADCASRGGLRVAMPKRGKVPVRRNSASVAASAGIVEQAPPAGTTMRCKDGTYLTGAPADNRCADHGGVAAVMTSAKPTLPETRPRP